MSVRRVKKKRGEADEKWAERRQIALLKKWKEMGGRDQKGLYKKVCGTCGRDFIAGMPWSKYCSKQCSPYIHRNAMRLALQKAERNAARELKEAQHPEMKPVPEMASHFTLAFDGCVPVKIASQFLSISRSTVNKMVREGRLPHIVEGKRRLIPRVALRKYVAKNLKWGIPR